MGTNSIKSGMEDSKALMIPVTKAFLPPIEEYTHILERAWNKQWITNRGDLIKELEERLKSRLGIDHIIITTNGTLSLQIPIKSLGIEGEIITTPFSYVATTSAIVWENCTPVFVDIDPDYLTIDETKIEEAITERTRAIMATHVFGNPCNVEEIEKIAKKHNLKVIYDAAHCFGVNYKGNSIFNYGDVSSCSFHATKIFHTGEGGAMFCNDKELHERLFYQHNFGHNGPHDFYGLGINAKASELQAAMGLMVLNHIDFIFEERKKVCQFYDDSLNHNQIKKIKLREDTEWNYSYYPVIFESEEVMLKVQEQLNTANIYPRRYFYPSLNTVEYAGKQRMEVSESIASRILCLPLYVGLTNKEQQLITETILNAV